MHPGSPGQHMLQIGGDVMEAEAEAGLFDSILGTWVQAVEKGAD
jgi:hypothetical protein